MWQTCASDNIFLDFVKRYLQQCTHLGPLVGLPSCDAVDQVTAAALIGPRWWAVSVWHHKGVSHSSCYLMHALHRAGLHAAATRLRASREVWHVPPAHPRAVVSMAHTDQTEISKEEEHISSSPSALKFTQLNLSNSAPVSHPSPPYVRTICT